jgi:hypothetical protein
MSGRPVRLIGVALILGLVTGCAKAGGPGDGGGSIGHPSAPSELVLRVEVGGGLIPTEYSLTQIPGFSLFGDGRVVVTGPQIEIYPGPALPNLQSRTVDEPGMQAILHAARDAGLMGSDHRYDEQHGVADAPTTTLTVTANGEVHTTSVYGLFESENLSGATAEEREARRELKGFDEKLGDLERWLPEGSVGPEQPYQWQALRVFVLPDFPESGDQLRQPEKEWPLVTPLSAFGQPVEGQPDVRCGVAEGSDADDLRPLVTQANQLTPWRRGDRTYHLLFRPLLPDESGC